MPNILVVDDEQAITNLIEVYLKNENFTVYKFYNGTDALNCLRTTRIDLAILDIMLPDIDGFTLCQKIRETHTFPILMLTARDGELDMINGFSLGADDYITKPFRPLELIARVKAHLRRANHYDEVSRQQPLSLTPTEFQILRILCENLGKVVSSEDLFQMVWGEKYYKNAVNTVMVHIRHLRSKMKDSAEHPKYIKTVWGVGYKIDET